ncbi:MULTISPECIES: hypothetical protein [unclassified Hyphomonas]|jgi:hypothetical protein|uniref:Uncharacterized protein n=1 Tax=hydrothermal vent metagenome TaxID=652676 RepID=A0A160TZM3_9ZZZZ|nr:MULTISPECIES: hypothetical protein [unclassified Hyphomonas]MAL42980.1 hypothetical protein [Hyphomonas sp.]MAX83464.1 hypothetical protein [Hyphomonas sp.]MBO6583096.1 hypothetical protein [Hyphomonas sp.]HAO36725.1 hypothetical protein [Hyphomonas sp.]HBN93363.1 hypothetical protein [Hyphomonas sp.]|tara:strand:+ start:10367 stop:11308 length:942 start_codon:yes stop_codon:yes gene_type:complete
MVRSASIIQRIQAVSRRSREDMRQVAQEMCSRGPQSDAEAQALFDFNARMRGADPDWDSRFVRVMARYVLARDAANGALTPANLDWLQERVAIGDRLRNRNLAGLFMRLLRKASGTPDGFGLIVLSHLCDQMILDNQADATSVGNVAETLLLSGPEHAPWVSRAEAAILFHTQESIEGSENDPSWNFLFARAIGNHLVARAHPNPHTERHALNRKHWLDPNDPNPGKFVGCLALGFDKGSWFEQMGREAERASLARRTASLAAKSKPAQPPPRTGWWRKSPPPNPVTTASNTLVDFLNREAPGLLAGLVVAAR